MTAGQRPGSTVIRCVENCEFWALPGEYTLYAKNNGDEEPQRFPFRIIDSNHYKLDVGNTKARTAGLALGLAGPVSIVAGIALSFAALDGAYCEYDCKGTSISPAPGVILLLTGLITTPVGWVMYAANPSRLRQIDQGGHGPTEPQQQVRVGMVGLGLGGLGLGAAGTF